MLHLTSADFWRWAVAKGTAELSAVTIEAGDAMGQEPLALHDAVQGKPHPDPKEFFAAMVNDSRLVVRLHVERLYGRPDGRRPTALRSGWPGTPACHSP